MSDHSLQYGIGAKLEPATATLADCNHRINMVFHRSTESADLFTAKREPTYNDGADFYEADVIGVDHAAKKDIELLLALQSAAGRSLGKKSTHADQVARKLTSEVMMRFDSLPKLASAINLVALKQPGVSGLGQ